MKWSVRAFAVGWPLLALAMGLGEFTLIVNPFLAVITLATLADV